MIGFLPLLNPPADPPPLTNSLLGPAAALLAPGVPGAPGPPGLIIRLRLFLLFAAFAPPAF